MWEFWRRQRRKIYITLGVLGGGYLLYRLYDGHKRRLSILERELALERENDELIKAQMQAHFEKIQRIADTTTWPHSMLCLSSRVAEELDLSHLTERLVRGKGQPDTLTPAEKLELWNRLKVLSFTRMVLSLWAMTILSLYIRVQVNILGRHLYIDTARVLGSSHLPEEADLIDRYGQQQFLASVDFLSNSALPNLSSNMQAAATEVLKGKQLKDLFNFTVLCETIRQILDVFMSMGSPYCWVNYLMPEDVGFYKLDSTNVTKFDQLMVEARGVLSSVEFGNIVGISLGRAVDALMEDFKGQLGEGNLLSGMPLAKLLPQVVQMSSLQLEEPSNSRFIQVMQKYLRSSYFSLFFTQARQVPSLLIWMVVSKYL